MRQFQFEETEIQGLVKVEPFQAEDERGFIIKDYAKEVFEENGFPLDVVETLFIASKKGVIRGLHFQRVKQVPKLVRCVSGHVWDIVVDLRRNSPTFKRYLSFDLEGGGAELMIPSGCATGTLALEPSVVSCKCGEKFWAEYDGGIQWNDPEIGIAWPVDSVGGLDQIVLSEKDRRLPTFAEFLSAWGGLD